MKSNSLQLTGVVLMEPFKNRIAPVSENTASAPADVISQLLAQSEEVPPRLSESQCDSFHVRRSCSAGQRVLFEAPCLRGVTHVIPAANYQASKGLLVKKSRAQSAHGAAGDDSSPLVAVSLSVFPCIALHFPSSITDSTPMQLLRGCP